MSWMEKLYQTYEAAVLLDEPPPSGDDKKKYSPLVPISHTQQNAHINITLDDAGNFIKAVVLKEKTQVVLPATEKSAGRTSGEEPHPLADKLQYVAKDYAAYGGKKKPYFNSYHDLLKKWCDSEYAHPKVKVVLQYIEKGTVIKDLVEKNIVHVDADNVLLTQWNSDNGEAPALFKLLPKDKGVLDQGSALVCWSVELTNDPVIDTWKDDAIQQSWIDYDSSTNTEQGLCYITGKQQVLASNHPKKIRHSGDGAKLISANDSGGYTYRGKFLDDKQANGIGFTVTQKAHNALSWLIQKQGFKNGDQVYVSWAVSGKETPASLINDYSDFDEEANLDEVEETQEPVETTLNYSTDLGEAYAKKLRKYIKGYAAKLDETDQIIIMGLDSATPGRMGILYYRELLSHEFLKRLEKWHYEFGWYQRYTKEIMDEKNKKKTSKTTYPKSSPLPKEIAKAAYGENVTDNLKKKTIERLMPCIVDGLAIPFDLVESCVRKAANRAAYDSKEQWLWEKNLCITCALYKGFCARHPDKNQRRNFDMALEENYHSRDYLYGRLLAVAERIEEDALNMTGEKRSTNAARLMQRFADQPAKTWLTIYKALDPYMQRLQASPTGFLYSRKKELGEILEMFSRDDYNNNAPLSGEFLLGYYCQRQKRYTKSTTPDATSDDTSSTGDTE
jgi:CRISPR-associated protein Csd1